MKFESILEFSTQFDVKKMCEVLGVNRSSYYRWLKRQKLREERNLRERRDVELIEEVFLESDKIFGYRNITRELKAQGVEISEYRVRRLMKENGFYPELAVKFKPVRNGKRDGRYCENKVKQEFKTEKKNALWAGDITYIKTSVGWVYLAVVMDLFNREIIGYSLSKKIDTELVKSALGNAVGRNVFYNRKRRHSALEYMTPVEYRLKYDNNRVA